LLLIPLEFDNIKLNSLFYYLYIAMISKFLS